MIFHITTTKNWAIAQNAGFYECDSLQTEGFIHTSTKQQIKGVYERYYSKETNLLVLCIEETLLNTKPIYEPSTNGEHYPHIYDKINLNAITKILTIEEFL